MSRRCLLFVLALCTLAAPAAADVFTFETPSGNIDCSVGLDSGSSDIRCAVYEREGSPETPVPIECPAGWSFHVMMFMRGPADGWCEPRRPNSSAFEVAPYGVRGEWLGISCLSSEQGLECRNSQGFGFFLSRRVQRVF